jgi:2-C-methyl-D-erythritol 2,4-cyclodiphosphate synthase
MAQNMILPRTGVGIDVHAFAPENDPQPLWLGGLFWEGEQGLSGHSDGDCVAHAAADALFSACGIGDLGTHFGTDRPEFAGASGVTLLGEAARIVRAAGFEIGNVAVQFVANRPKFGPRREESQRVLSEAAGAPGQCHGHHQRRPGFHRPRRRNLRSGHGPRLPGAGTSPAAEPGPAKGRPSMPKLE